MPAKPFSLPNSGAEETTALYVHWPFCEKKCPYCDFNSHVVHHVDQDAWRTALIREISSYQAQYPSINIASIFFGGGTPSLMPPATVSAILDQVAKRWHMADGCEVTLEANPSSVEADNFKDLRQAGVNRLSIGVQSLRNDALRFLGRLHGAEEAKKALDIAATHFDRRSFDLIYARPEQSREEWALELQEALAFSPSHLSLYQLTLEPGTVFYQQAKRGLLTLPGEDQLADLFADTQSHMQAAGLPAYETSNHARPGEESRHNLVYWQGGSYIGIGPGAHGRLTGDDTYNAYAQTNRRSPEGWRRQVMDQGHGLDTLEGLTNTMRFEEMVMMGLRLRKGINLTQLTQRTGLAWRAHLNTQQLQNFEEMGVVKIEDDHLKATDEGWPLIGHIVSQLLT